MAQYVPVGLFLTTAAVKVFLIAAHVHGFIWLRNALRHRDVSRASWIAGGVAGSLLLLTLWGDMFELAFLNLDIPRHPTFSRLLADLWTASVFVSYALALPVWLWLRWRARQQLTDEPLSPERRKLFEAAAGVALVGPAAVAGYGVFIGRKRFEVREVDLPVPNLAPDLDGLRLVQVTDIHAGVFLSPKEVETVVAMANETKPHLALVTGDLITGIGDPLEQTIDVLANLRAEAGVYGCMGNHEAFAECLGLADRYGARKGIRFLRHQAEPLRFGDGLLNLAGVDYQRKSQGYLEAADQLILPGAANVLLSHNPDVFPKAAALGYDAVISGHTHGGQVTLEIVEQTANAGHFFTPYVVGRYEIDQKLLYVSRGVGCVNLPMRIGAWPEISLLTLRRA